VLPPAPYVTEQKAGFILLISSISLKRFSSPFSVPDVGGHTGPQSAVRVADADLHAEYLVDAFLARLHVTREKLRFLIDLLQFAVERRVREGIDAHFDLLAGAQQAELCFRNVDADVKLVAFEKRGNRRVWRDQVARPHVEHLDYCRGRSHHAAFDVARTRIE
jgi:hypothetical protein